jgi:hypothetical protein
MCLMEKTFSIGLVCEVNLSGRGLGILRYGWGGCQNQICSIASSPQAIWYDRLSARSTRPPLAYPRI